MEVSLSGSGMSADFHGITESVSDPMIGVKDEENDDLRNWENTYNKLIEQAMQTVGDLRRRRLLRPGEKIILLHIDIDSHMKDFFGTQYEAAEYAVQLIAIINEEIYHPLGFHLQVFSINVRDSYLTMGDSTRSYLYKLKETPVPKNVHLVHHLTTRKIGGGIAYVGGLYHKSRGYAVSASLRGSYNLWDKLVVAHELGHNFGSPHTHGFSPVIDNCGNGCSGKISGGTIMSYCHTCTGGLNNIDFRFHDRVKKKILNDYNVMKHKLQDAQDCYAFADKIPQQGVGFYLGNKEINACFKINVNACKTCLSSKPQTCQDVHTWNLEELASRQGSPDSFVIHSMHNKKYCWAAGCAQNEVALETCNLMSAKQHFTFRNSEIIAKVGQPSCSNKILKSRRGKLNLRDGVKAPITHWCLPGLGNPTDPKDYLERKLSSCGHIHAGDTSSSYNVIGYPAKDVGFNFTAPIDPSLFPVKFDTCGSKFDTYIAVYTTDLKKKVKFNDDGTDCDTSSHLELTVGDLVMGDEYVLVLEGYGAAEGEFVLKHSCGKEYFPTQAPTVFVPLPPGCAIDCVEGSCNLDGLENACCSGGRCSQIGCQNPQCHGGECNQSESQNPRCTGGKCNQKLCVNPSCTTHCHQVKSQNATCFGRYCNQKLAVHPKCLGGYCHQEGSVRPWCRNRCNQIDTSDPHCKHTCRGVHTKQCTYYMFDIRANGRNHSFNIPGTGCRSNDQSVICCLRKTQNYTVECIGGTNHGWGGQGLRIGDAEILFDLCTDFTAGNKLTTYMRLDRIGCEVKTITVKTFGYAYEMSWSISPSKEVCKSTKTYGTHSAYNETCCLKPGAYTLECSDEGADGWHNSYLEIDGNKYCSNFVNGISQKENITIEGNYVATAPPCKDVEFISKIGGFGYENSWSILDSMGESVQCAEANFKSMDTRKTTCCLPEGAYELTCEDIGEDGWNGHIAVTNYKQRSHVEIENKKYCEFFDDGTKYAVNFTIDI